MIPILSGRIQTRLFIIVVVGGLWTALITPILPGLFGVPLGTKYLATFVNLGWVLVLGLLWEVLYQFIQHQRWEKDWPIMFAFLVGVNEGILVWIMVGVLGLTPVDSVPGVTFVVHFVTTWIVTWLYLVGPIRAVFWRHRFNGGRFVGG